MKTPILTIALVLATAHAAAAAVIQFGDQDVLGTGTYASDPLTGATLEGLAPGVSTIGDLGLAGQLHTFPFSPSPGEFAGTDQIYVGSSQTYSHDGYSLEPGRIAGPQELVMDYSAVVPLGHVITSLTLGIAFDDFQYPLFGSPDPAFPGYPTSGPYRVSVNGLLDPALAGLANMFLQTGPRVSFATIGISPAVLTANHQLRVTIDQEGDGGDGWAIDFLTVGVTSRAASVPEPAALALCLVGATTWAGFRARRRRGAGR